MDNEAIIIVYYPKKFSEFSDGTGSQEVYDGRHLLREGVKLVIVTLWPKKSTLEHKTHILKGGFSTQTPEGE